MIARRAGCARRNGAAFRRCLASRPTMLYSYGGLIECAAPARKR